MGSLWLKDGTIVIDENGAPIQCDDCPCGGCPTMCEQGQYHITVTASTDNESFYDYGDTHSKTDTGSASFEGTVDVYDFLHGSDNDLPLTGTVAGSTCDEYTVQYAPGLSFSYSVTLASTSLEDSTCHIAYGCTDGVKGGQFWANGSFNNVQKTDCNDGYCETFPVQETFQTLPSNYGGQFLENEVVVQKLQGKDCYIIKSMSMKNIVSSSTSSSTVQKNEIVTVSFTYIPPPQEE